jgi:hypothetical protein
VNCDCGRTSTLGVHFTFRNVETSCSVSNLNSSKQGTPEPVAGLISLVLVASKRETISETFELKKLAKASARFFSSSNYDLS